MGRSKGKRGRRVCSKSNRNGANKDVDPQRKVTFEEAMKKRRQRQSAKRNSNDVGSNRHDNGPASKGSQNSSAGRDSKGSQDKSAGPKNDIHELLAKAEDNMEMFNFDLAKMFCQKALQLEPDSVAALELMGDLLAESGDVEEAKLCFLKAVESQPESGYIKYMYLGQLAEGIAAVRHYQKGIEIMKKEQKAFQESQDQAAASFDCQQVTSREISKAYSTIAEIYLTDCCFEDDAEQRCKECLDKALEEDHRNAEAHQLLASYWLSMEKKENAKASIGLSLSLWMSDDEKEENSTQDEDQERENTMTYASRIQCAKILMELEDYDQAESVLCGLLEDSDEVVQVWYMLGLVYSQRGPEEENIPYARYYLNKCKKLFKRIKCGDQPVMEHITELLKKLGPGEGDDDDWLEKTQLREEELVEIGDESDGDDDSSSSEEEETEAMEH